MIAWLAGTLLSKDPGVVIVDVGGVGYELQVSMNSFYQLPDVGAKVSLEVVTYVREDQITLYGFLIDGEKALFKLLIGISGVGPRLALNVLSGIDPDEMALAVATADLRRLRAIPGVGKRTAERIVVELKDKLSSPGPQSPPRVTPAPSSRSPRDDLVLALTTLGYKKAEIDHVLGRMTIASDATPEALIKDALRLLQPRRMR